MRSFAKVSVAVLLTAVVSGTASAATIVLSGTPGAPGSGIATIDMWFDDPTRNADLLGLQFDVDLPATGQGSLAAAPNFRRPNSSRDNGTDAIQFPFDLSNDVGDPAGAIDVRVVHAANAVFDINGLVSRAALYPNCSGAACAKQAQADATNRVYLGSFDMAYDGTTGVFYSLPANALFGEGDEQPQNGTDPIILELRTTSGGTGLRIAGLLPEPASLALMGLALAALGAIRRRS